MQQTEVARRAVRSEMGGRKVARFWIVGQGEQVSPCPTPEAALQLIAAAAWLGERMTLTSRMLPVNARGAAILA